MPPKKAKGKGKKRKKKGKKPVLEDALTEAEKIVLEMTITELNRQLAQLRSKSIEFEEKNAELKEKFQKMNEDRGDVIVYLRQILQEKNDEIAGLQETVTKLQEEQQHSQNDNEKRIEEMEIELKKMQEQLISEIKLLEGKLNSLEEFRLQKEELMKKFEIQENVIEEQFERHKRELYEIEKRFIIAKDKLKKDMEARLAQLSKDFEDATEIRIAATTHRVIKENILINNELDDMLSVHKKLYTENVQLKRRDKTLKQQAELHAAEKKKANAKEAFQKNLIESLTTEHDNFKHKLFDFRNIEKEMNNTNNEITELNRNGDSLQDDIKILEQNIYLNRLTIERLEQELLYYQKEQSRLADVLDEAVTSIRDSFKPSRRDRPGDKNWLLSKRENLTNQLFRLMIAAKDNTTVKDTFEKITIAAAYSRGDLGFVPRPIKPEDKLSTIHLETVESQTGGSLMSNRDDSVSRRFQGRAKSADTDLSDSKYSTIEDMSSIEEKLRSDESAPALSFTDDVDHH